MMGTVQMQSNKLVKMIQIHQANWTIQTATGTILKEDITLGLYDEAEEYVRKYITSFSGWSYEMLPLKPKTKETK